MKRKRSARFAARLGVLSLLGGTILAAQAAPAHALCAASCVQQTLADMLTSTTVPDVGPTLQELKNDIGNLRLPPLSHLSPCYEALDCDRLIASAQQLVNEAAAAVQQILDEPSPCYQTVDCNQLRQYLQSTTDQLITQAQLLVSEAQDLISGVVPLITGVVSGVGDPVQKIQDTAGLVVTTAGQIIYVVEQVVHGVPILKGAPSTSSTQAGTPVMLNPGQALDDPTGVELWDFTPDSHAVSFG